MAPGAWPVGLPASGGLLPWWPRPLLQRLCPLLWRQPPLLPWPRKPLWRPGPTLLQLPSLLRQPPFSLESDSLFCGGCSRCAVAALPSVAAALSGTAAPLLVAAAFPSLAAAPPYFAAGLPLLAADPPLWRPPFHVYVDPPSGRGRPTAHHDCLERPAQGMKASRQRSIIQQ